MIATLVLGGALDADTLVAIADGAPIALDPAALAAVARKRPHPPSRPSTLQCASGCPC